MKKYFGFVLSVLLVVSFLAGCGSSGGSAVTSSESRTPGSEPARQGDSPSGEEEHVVLKISHNMDFVTIPNSVIAAADRLMERYAAEGRNVKIEFEQDYQRIDWVEYHNNLVFADKSGDAPDIFSLDDGIKGFVDADMLLDISEIMDDKFVDGIFAPYMVDGKAYGLPFDMPLRVMYYNKAGLSKIGWTDEQIAALPQQIASGEFTFEQFIELAAEVQAKGGAQWGLAHRPGQGGDFFDILNVLGGEYYNADGKLVFDEAGLTRFFQFTYDNANVSKITPPDLNQMGWDTINKMVAGGDAFAYYGPLYSSTYVAMAGGMTVEELVESVSFVLYPVSQYNDKPFTIVAPQGMGISSRTKYPEICKDLFKELVDGSSDQLAAHASTILTLSSVKAANVDPILTENPVLKEVTYMADYGVTPPTIEGINAFQSEFHKQIIQLELGQITPEQAVQDLKTQIGLSLGDAVVYK